MTLDRTVDGAVSSGTVLGVPPITMLHNPRCSKSRAALEILLAAGRRVDHDLIVIDYLVDPPASGILYDMIVTSGMPPASFIRMDPAPDIEVVDLSSAASVSQFLAEHPEAMQRPVVTDGATTVIGRPPERVQELLRG